MVHQSSRVGRMGGRVNLPSVICPIPIIFHAAKVISRDYCLCICKCPYFTYSEKGFKKEKVEEDILNVK